MHSKNVELASQAEPKNNNPYVKGSMSRRRLLFIVALIFVILVAIVTPFVLALRTVLQMEERLGAFTAAYHATLSHIHESDGSWPRSWDELREADPKSDFDWVARHVTIDFDADPESISKQPAEAFTAMAPNGRCFDVTNKIETMILALKHYHRDP